MTETVSIDRNALISELGLTIESVFVPFSKSRNAKEKDPSLNWKVTLKRDGREIITTDYMAGCGHCPAYKAKGLGIQTSVMRDNAIRYECEHGHSATLAFPKKAATIEPDTLDVLYSLMTDADVLNEYSYEDWAANTGYDPDSRKGEALYRQCLDIALKLRNGLGEANLTKLREAFQDY